MARNNEEKAPEETEAVTGDKKVEKTVGDAYTDAAFLESEFFTKLGISKDTPITDDIKQKIDEAKEAYKNSAEGKAGEQNADGGNGGQGDAAPTPGNTVNVGEDTGKDQENPKKPKDEMDFVKDGNEPAGDWRSEYDEILKRHAQEDEKATWERTSKDDEYEGMKGKLCGIEIDYQSPNKVSVDLTEASEEQALEFVKAQLAIAQEKGMKIPYHEEWSDKLKAAVEKVREENPDYFIDFPDKEKDNTQETTNSDENEKDETPTNEPETKDGAENDETPAPEPETKDGPENDGAPAPEDKDKSAEEPTVETPTAESQAEQKEPEKIRAKLLEYVGIACKDTVKEETIAAHKQAIEEQKYEEVAIPGSKSKYKQATNSEEAKAIVLAEEYALAHANKDQEKMDTCATALRRYDLCVTSKDGKVSALSCKAAGEKSYSELSSEEKQKIDAAADKVFALGKEGAETEKTNTGKTVDSAVIAAARAKRQND